MHINHAALEQNSVSDFLLLPPIKEGYSGYMSSKQRIPLTDDLMNEIQGHIDRTLVGPHLLLKQAQNPIPSGLTRPTIENWLYRRCKTARTDFIEFVLSEWRTLPDGDLGAPLPRNRATKTKPGYVEITPEMRAELQSYRDKKLIPSQLFKLVDDIPDGLQPSMISAWVNGNAETAREEYLKYVLSSCRSRNPYQ